MIRWHIPRAWCLVLGNVILLIPVPGHLSLPPKTSCALDCYGDPLPADALARMGTLRFRRSLSHSAIVFSPDGKTIALAATDHLIHLWNPATAPDIRRFMCH